MASAWKRSASCTSCSPPPTWTPCAGCAQAFNPDGRLSPGKMLPTAGACGVEQTHPGRRAALVNARRLQPIHSQERRLPAIIDTASDLRNPHAEQPGGIGRRGGRSVPCALGHLSGRRRHEPRLRIAGQNARAGPVAGRPQSRGRLSGPRSDRHRRSRHHAGRSSTPCWPPKGNGCRSKSPQAERGHAGRRGGHGLVRPAALRLGPGRATT